MHEIYTCIKQHEQQMLEDLQDLVERESPSDDKELNDAIGEAISVLFEKLTGGRAERIPSDTYGDHCRLECGEGEGQILVLGHFDTVWPVGTLEEMPFGVEDGKVYGPGTYDMKAGIIQGFYAVKALIDLKEELGCKVVFLLNSDEEMGSPTSRVLVEEEAKKSKCVLVLEPSATKEGAVKISRKGVGMFQLRAKGIPAHAGAEPEKGKSAIEEIAHQILYLHGLTDLEKGTTVNVGFVQGGTKYNVIAAEAVAEIDLRVKTKEERDRILPLIENLQPQLEGTSLSVTVGTNKPPMERTKENVALFETTKKLAKEHLNMDLREIASGGGSDGNYASVYAPTLDGLGAVGDGAHAVYEHVVLSELALRSSLVALLIREMSWK